MTPADLEALGRRYLDVGGPWLKGMKLYTTNAGGFPLCPAGTEIYVDINRTMEDLLAEGMVGCTCKENCEDEPAKCRSFGLPEAWPDFSDHATQGVVLDWLREWYPTAHLQFRPPTDATVPEPWNTFTVTAAGLDGQGWHFRIPEAIVGAVEAHQARLERVRSCGS